MPNKQDMCPICTKPFQKEEVIIQYLTWAGKEASSIPKLGHLDCVLYLSKTEDRKHPPV
ncbi:hypothetical protein PEC106664_21650 [Pectobacterium carotovorum subsp. carotovorum]|nr:hypothetical protein PEC106664_21650 [Pectobacterium carotovorum subsp. carotovorum]